MNLFGSREPHQLLVLLKGEFLECSEVWKFALCATVYDELLFQPRALPGTPVEVGYEREDLRILNDRASLGVHEDTGFLRHVEFDPATGQAR